MKILFLLVILFSTALYCQSNPDGDKPSVHVMPYFVQFDNDILHYEKTITSIPVIAFKATFKYPINKHNTVNFVYEYQPIEYSFIPTTSSIKTNGGMVKINGYTRKMGILFSYYF